MKKFQQLKLVLLLGMLAASIQLWAQTPQQLTFTWEATAGVEKEFGVSSYMPLIIDWGDGTSDNSEAYAAHTYSKSGIYQVRVKCIDAKGRVMGLDINKKDVISLDVTDALSLNYLFCNENRITNLDVSKNSELTAIQCSYNSLIDLDVSKNLNLKSLDCSFNQIASLVTINLSLQSLKCNHNQLSNLDVSKNISLTFLHCQNNRLSSALDVSNSPALTALNCSNNRISALDISKNIALGAVNCTTNQLSALDATLNVGLTYLGCGNNKLTHLDISKNILLDAIICSHNQLTQLDVSKNKDLTQIYCESNALTALNLSNNPKLKKLFCFSNQLTYLDLSKHIALTHLECQRNYLRLSDLYQYSNPNLQYNLKTPQALPTQNTHVNVVIDLSKEALFDGVATTFKVLKKQGPEIAAINVDYTLSQGKLVFKTPGEYSVEMTNTAIVSKNLVCYVKMSYLVTEVPVTATEQLTFTWEATAGVEKEFGVSSYMPLIIDWGDGTSDNNSEAYAAHTYSKSGIYQVSVKCIDAKGRVMGLDINKKDVISLDVTDALSLNYLFCNENRITNLDVSRNSELTAIQCSYNSLIDLDVSKNLNLQSLKCNHNQLSNLDVSKSISLTFLHCQNNRLSSALDVSNSPALTALNCSNNRISALDISKNIALGAVNCTTNQLSALDATLNVGLTYLGCGNNKLTHLDISKNILLDAIICSHNQLTQLDVSKNKDLTQIYCESNALTALNLSNNPKLKKLFCFSNQLTYLDLSKQPQLYEFDCSNNFITALDINMDAKFLKFTCSGNQLTSLDIPANIPELNCLQNALPLSKLYPFSKQSNKTRAIGSQQLHIMNLSVNSEINLSGESVFDGVATNFKIEKGSASAIINTDYTLTGGKIRFIRPGQYRVVMSNNVIRSRSANTDGDAAIASFFVNITGTKSALLADQAYADAETVTVYPNPTSGLVYVNSNREEQPRVKVYDATGNLLLQVQKSEVDLSGYPNGLYLFQVGSQTLKVIKH